MTEPLRTPPSSHRPSGLRALLARRGVTGTDRSAPRPALGSHLEGPPLRLPAALDRILEAWWERTPRARTLLVTVGSVGLAVLILLRVVLSPYGPPVDVLVARYDLEVGHLLTAQDLLPARWPRRLVPTDALRADSATAVGLGGTVLAGRALAGAPVTERHLASGGRTGMLADWAVAVPAARSNLPPLTTDDRIDLIVLLGDGSGRTLAGDVRILGIDEDLVWLEVARSVAADIVAAERRGTLGAVLLPA
jgi:hypothetical protein